MTRFNEPTGLFPHTDAYEFTMIETAIANGLADTPVVAEVFARSLPEGEGIFWGRETINRALSSFNSADIKSYLQVLESTGFSFELTKKKLDEWKPPIVTSLAQGQRFVPYMPVVQIEAPFWQTILMETVICGVVNHETKIATRAEAYVSAANGKPICDMSARRSHPLISPIQTEIALGMGFSSTSLLSAAPYATVTGTCSHSLPVLYEGVGRNEEQSFRDHLSQLGASTLPVDAYDWESTVKACGWLPEGSAVRFDSGDIFSIVPSARKILDDIGRTDIGIVVCGRLTPEAIASFEMSELPITAYGVGTKLIDSDSLEMVYKIVEVDGTPESKRSADKHVPSAKKYVFWTGAQIAVLPFKPSDLYQQMLTDVSLDTYPIEGEVLVIGQTSRVGLYSGTFDPPHEGHVMCVEVIAAQDLDALLVSVTGSPWYKKPSSAEMRLDAAHRAFDREKVILIDVEIANNYECAYETLEFLTQFFKDIRMFVGTDANFEKWKNFSRVDELCQIVMLSRYGYENETEYSAIVFDSPDISSSKIRASVTKEN